MVAHGTPCLGPVTHAGCGALCPSYDRGCYGCFGPMEAPNAGSLGGWLAGHGMPERDVVRLYRTVLRGRAGVPRRERDARWLSARSSPSCSPAWRARARCTCASATAASRTCELRIYEPPRFFEAFLRGRALHRGARHHRAHLRHLPGRLPDELDRGDGGRLRRRGRPTQVRALRRLLYCGEWIESHALHVFMLHAPDFLGYASAFEMARDHRDDRRAARCALKKAGNDADARRRRARDPPGQRPRRRLLPRAARAPSSRRVRRAARARARVRARGRAPGPRRCRSRTSRRTSTFVALRDPDALRDRGRPAGLERRPRPRARPSTRSTSSRSTSQHSTALHSRLRDGDALPRRAAGALRAQPRPAARRSRARRPTRPGLERGRAATRSAASSCARSRSSTRSTRRCACIAAYEPPDPPAVEVAPRAGDGLRLDRGAARPALAPLRDRRRRHDPRRADRAADLAEPGPRSSRACAASSQQHVELADDELQLRCEQAIRSYDPCISCATHFLRLEVDRGVTRHRRRQRAGAATTAPGLAVARRVRELAPRRRRARARGRRDGAGRRCGRAPSTSSSSTPRARARPPGTVRRFDAARRAAAGAQPALLDARLRRRRRRRARPRRSDRLPGRAGRLRDRGRELRRRRQPEPVGRAGRRRARG